VRDLSFASPDWLFLLLVVPLTLIVALVLERRRARYAVAYTNVELLASVSEHRYAWRRWIPLVLLLLALALAASAVAKPKAKVSVSQNNSIVVLLIDVSGSMEANDVKPSRIAAAVEALNGFVATLPSKVKVGLVEFSTQPAALVDPTTDRGLLSNGISYLTPNGGTAIGDGIATAVDMGEKALKDAGVTVPPGEKPPLVIVLSSDGAQNRGTLGPIQGALRAKKAGIRIYTVSVGTPNGYVVFGNGLQTIKANVPPDPETMAKISAITGGQSYSAFTSNKLSGIYKSLGSRIGHKTETRSIGSWFAIVAAIMLLAAVGLARIWGALLP
jgi:Ca-activated chloride channel family protein